MIESNCHDIICKYTRKANRVAQCKIDFNQINSVKKKLDHHQR